MDQPITKSVAQAVEQTLEESVKPTAKKKNTVIIIAAVTITIATFITMLFILTNKNSKKNDTQGQEPSTELSNTKQNATLLSADIAYIEKKVYLSRASENVWVEAKQGDILQEGDSVKTEADSKAVLIIDNGDAIRLNSNSEVKLFSLQPENIIIEVVEGECYNRVSSSTLNTYRTRGLGIEAIAMGTAYTFKSNVEEKSVEVAVYESKVRLNVDDKEVPTLSKAIVDAENNELEVKEVTEEEYNSKFIAWNKEQDSSLSDTKLDDEEPTIEITSPTGNISTTSSTVRIKGKVKDASALRKLKVDDTIYTDYDYEGKGFNLDTGAFDIEYKLTNGTNSIQITAYDIYWNSKTETLSITKTVEQVEETKSFYISSVTDKGDGKIKVSWVASNIDSPNGFKIIVAEDHIPVFPGDTAVYVSDKSARSGYVTNLEDDKYKVRVCVYNGNGGCSLYTSNTKEIDVNIEEKEEPPVSTVTSITLTGGGNNISWSVAGESPLGFKVVWSKDPAPEYPGDEYHYYNDPSARNDTLDPYDGSGNYYVRVCEYLGGACGIYSNEITVEL